MWWLCSDKAADSSRKKGAKSYNLKAQGFEAVYNNSEIEMEVGNRTEKGEIKYIKKKKKAYQWVLPSYYG